MVLLGSECVNIGKAPNQTFGDRILTHVVKLLGWEIGNVRHPREWRQFSREQGYDLRQISFRLWPEMEADEVRISGIEAFLLCAFETRYGRLPRLNRNRSNAIAVAIDLPPEV
jgi:hypothetical protein